MTLGLKVKSFTPRSESCNLTFAHHQPFSELWIINQSIFRTPLAVFVVCELKCDVLYFLLQLVSLAYYIINDTEIKGCH